MASVINQIKLGDTEYAIAASAYAECSTDETTIGKAATICTDGDTTNTAFTLVKGVAVQIKFIKANQSSSAITLDVNQTGGKAVYYRGAAFANANAIRAGSIHTFVYDGTYWQLVGDLSTDNNQTIKQDGVTGSTANRFGTCSTAAGTAAKTVSITTGTFSLEAGARVSVKFSSANTASTPTLNVNSKGAKNIFHKGAQIASGSNKSLLAGVCDFIYDGTQWHLVGNYIDTDNQRAYYTSNPAMNGTASAGSSANVSRGDHVHPTDTTRAPTSHASSSTTYGVGDWDNYGHVKLIEDDLNGLVGMEGQAAGIGHTHSQYAETDHNHDTSEITSGTLPIERGGTGASNGAEAVINIGAAPKNHAGTSTQYGIGDTANYGHVKIKNGDLNGKSNTNGVAAGLAHTHSQYAPLNTNLEVIADGIVSGNSMTLETQRGGPINIINETSDGTHDHIILHTDYLNLSKQEPVNDEESSHIMMYNDQLDISVRGQANTTDGYDSEITSGISVSSHQVTIGDINGIDNDPEYDAMAVNIDADRVNLNATYAQVNNSKIMTARDFDYNRSTGILTINTSWED
jgi:hypothetical protein